MDRRASGRSRPAVVWPLLVLLSGCTAALPEIPPELAARLEAAAAGGRPALCRVPPAPQPELSAEEVRAELERTRAQARYEAGIVRWRAGLRALPPEPPAPPAPPRTEGETRVAAPAPVVETGVGETVRTETATGSLADFLLWLEGALPRRGG